MDRQEIGTCPAGHPLVGLGTYCWDCREYASRDPEQRRTPDPVSDGTPDTRSDPSRSEKEIQLGIKRFLATLGFSVWDTSQPFAAKITPGLPDLFATGRGLCLWIEVKSAKGKQTDAQRRFEREVTANGGLYLVCRSEREAVEWLTRISGLAPQ